MAFTLNYLMTKLSAAQRAVTETVVSWDPEGASEAQIAEYSDNVDAAARIAAKAGEDLLEDKEKVATLQAEYDRKKAAAKIMSDKIDAANAEGNTERASVLDIALTKLLDELESKKVELADLVQAAKDSEEYYAERKDIHAQGVEKLKRARTNLQQAMREQLRAAEQAERAREREATAKATAGITAKDDTMDVALNAMKRNAAKDRREAEAHRMTTDALEGDTAADKEIQAALAEAAGTATPKKSAKDRLAGL